jgi:hypothetical protein
MQDQLSGIQEIGEDEVQAAWRFFFQFREAWKSPERHLPQVGLEIACNGEMNFFDLPG